MKKALSIALAAALALTAFATGCSSKPASKMDSIKKAGKIVMYTNPAFAPYEFLEDDKIVGVDVEIGEAIAEKLGVKLEIVSAEFGGIVASIGSGKGDMAISGITINDERKATVDFSTPYVDSIQYIIVPENSEIKLVEDIAGLKVGAQEGTTGAMLIEDEISKGVLVDKGASITQYANGPLAMQDLMVGRIQGVVIDELVAIEIAKANPGYMAVPLAYASGAPLTEQFGVAIAKGNEELLTVINEVVQGMVDAGTISELVDKYSN